MVSRKKILFLMSVFTLIVVIIFVQSARADSNIVVLNDEYKVGQGEDLQTLVTLTPKTGTKIDVTMNFKMINRVGKVLTTKSESLVSEGEIEISREFDVSTLTPGDYVISLEITQSGVTEYSSAYFSVKGREAPETIGQIVIFLAIVIIIIAIVLVAIFTSKKIEEKR